MDTTKYIEISIMIRALVIILVYVLVYVSPHTMYNPPSYYIRQNLNLLGGWASSNKSDPAVIKISQFVVNSTFHHPYQFKILLVKTQVVAGLNYDLLLKIYLNSSSSSPCWSKDRFLVWDHFGNLTITNHTEICRYKSN